MSDLKPWEKLLDSGEIVGRDPREMTQDDLEGLGHRSISPLRALRLRCLDCCAGNVAEVRNCTARKCPSWPFRMGSSPWRAFKLSPAQRANLEKLKARKRPVSEAGPTPAVAPPEGE